MTYLNTKRSPARHTGAIFLVGIAMSIGWGIRGNFGHQYGAAFAGCLASIAACLLSGRDDWRSKILYFAFFGSIGWAFGAAVSYMQVISYTESGYTSTQWYGYGCLFIIGFLWAGLGVAGTALAAVAPSDRLVNLFKPILFVFGSWLLLDLVEDPIANLLSPASHFDGNWARHKNPLYWFDANYLPSLFALLAVGLYDLVERREKNAFLLLLYAILGVAAGWLLQAGLRLAGWEHRLSSLLTYSLGDPSYIDPATGAPAYDVNNLLNNWPQWFNYYPQHIGWFIGLLSGIILYFTRFGRFRNGASLIVYLAGGWFIFFLALPVLGSLFFVSQGGIRMTPPRSEDWAGIFGVFVGAVVWLRRNNYFSVAAVSVVGGTIGGLGFSGIQWIKQLMMAPGNPRILQAKGIMPGSAQYENIVSSWANWQGQNWHSFLEQSYGFVNGIAVAIALGLLAKRLATEQEQAATREQLNFRKLALGICTVYTLLAIPYVNMVQNVESWSDSLNPEIWSKVITSADGSQEKSAATWDAPYFGRLPGIKFLHLTPEWWYSVIWILLLVIFIALIRRHYKNPLAIIPQSWLGKGQLIFLILLWTMIIGNFERELIQFTPGRLLTEWVITLNAVILTFFLLTSTWQSNSQFVVVSPESFKPLYKRSWRLAVIALLVSSAFFLLTNRMIYQYSPSEKLDFKKYHLRFGPQADWRTRPILKNGEHK